MNDKEISIKKFILKHPNESGNWIYQESKKVGLGIRKTNFYGILREVRKLPEPSITKKEKSIPIIYRKVKPTKPKVKPTIHKPLSKKEYAMATLGQEKPKSYESYLKDFKPTKPKTKVKVVKLPKVEFKDTKFGKIVGKLEKAHNISERKAILHARKILLIPKSDYHKINQKDVQILLTDTP